mgnify:CR=1 FL=1
MLFELIAQLLGVIGLGHVFPVDEFDDVVVLLKVGLQLVLVLKQPHDLLAHHQLVLELALLNIIYYLHK